jgi:Holliday junction resolvase RusA-like endonuclease
MAPPVEPLTGTVAVAFTVPGKPIPKARPRVVKGRTYTPETTADYELAVALKAAEAMRGKDPIATDVAVAFLFERTDRIACDIDNLVKSALDGMSSVRPSKAHMGRNGPVLRNDAQVVELRARLIRGASRHLTTVTLLHPNQEAS